MTERPRARTSSGHAASAPPAPASDPAETGDWSPFPSLDRARAGASAGSAQTPLPPPPTEPLAAAPTTAAAQVATLPQAPVAAPVPAPAVPDLRYYWYAHPFWRAVAIVAALAAAGVLVWLLVLRGDSTPTVQPAGSPAILTPSELATFSDQIGQPIYWVGPAAGARLEVTQTPTNSKLVFVRYLTGAAPAGDSSTQFLTIGTYPMVNAYAELQTWARRHSAPTSRVAGGGIAASVPGSPTSVFYANPARDIQVEVYDPDRGKALRLVRSGAVRPVTP